MNNYVVLNYRDHGALKVITKRSKRLGDDVMHVMTFPHEFRDVQSCYPIYFKKDLETGSFYPIALFGLEEGQNLFLDDQDMWDATYIPLMSRRHPFLIAMQSSGDKSDDKKPVISIDMGNPRVNEIEGELLFKDDGQPSTYTKQIMKILESIHLGNQSNSDFISEILELDLLESFTLEVTLSDGSKHALSGFYIIKETTLNNLKKDQLASLQKKGYLLPIYMAVASHARMRSLVDKKDKRVG